MSIYEHVSGSLSALDRAIVSAVPPGGNWRDLPPEIGSNRVAQIRASAARGEGSRSTYYGRLSPDRPSYTISTYFSRPGNGCFIHPHFPRLISVREAARLQSFPDSFRFAGDGRARYIQVGNAVPPLLAYQLADVLPRGPMVDLFSGAGGLSLGFGWAGFPIVAAVDFDEAACAAFSKNHDATRVLQADLASAEVHSRTMQVVRHLAGRDGVFLLSGGPPCQGFSTAGDCRLDDPRNQLVFAFLRSVEALHPRLVLMENVAAIMHRRARGILSELRSALHSLGYRTSVVVMHAEGYGVPQLRRRLFLIGAKEGEHIRWPKPWKGLLAPGYFGHQPGHDAAQTAGRPVTVEEAIGDLPERCSPNADTPVPYSVPASSAFQKWARGEIGVTEVVPPVEVVTEGTALPLFGLGALR